MIQSAKEKGGYKKGLETFKYILSAFDINCVEKIYRAASTRFKQVKQSQIEFL